MSKGKTSMKLNRICQIALVTLTLAACGGGGGSGGSATSTTSSFAGTAAVGAPITNATVNVYDKSGALVATTTTDASGAYSIASVNSTNGPFVIEVVGSVGDSNAKFYAVSNAGGTTNVSQISNAIAGSLSSSGVPTDLVAGNSISSTQITASESAFTSALSGLMQSMNVSGSLISQTFTSAMDSALDHIKIGLSPNGSIEMSTSQGEVAADLMGNGSFTAGVDTPVPYKVNTYALGTLPSANDAANLPGFSANVIATAATLETLRTQVQTCFSHAAAQRATQAASGNVSPNWTSINSDCQNLAVDTSASESFKHESYYWIDNSSSNSTTIPSGCVSQNAFCLGFFGAMLTDSNYDSLIFKTPTHISPIDVTNGIWKVQFPVQYSDGSLGQFGDVVGTSYAVVKYDATAHQFKFYGNQRDVMSSIMPSVTKAQKAGTTNYRVEVGFNIYVNPYNSRSLKKANGTQVYVVKTQIQPINSSTGMLPAGGVYMANKLSNQTVSSGSGSNKNYRFNVCTFMNFEDPSLISNSYYVGTAGASSCSGVIRLDYKEYVMTGGSLVATTGAYTPTNTNTPTWVSDWNSSGTIQSNQSLVHTATAKRGEPYLFTFTMSDGSTLKYVNRLTNSTMTTDNAAKLNFPSFAAGVSDSFATFNGATSSSFSVSWNALKTATIFADAIFWDRGEVNNTVKFGIGVTSNSVSCPTSTATVTGTNYNGDPISNVLNCQLSNNWQATTASGPDSGILQLKARTYEGLFIQSQIRQY